MSKRWYKKLLHPISHDIEGVFPEFSCSPGRGVLACIRYIGMCGPKGYSFAAILVIIEGIVFVR